jgi:hypothetical protein
MRNLIALGLLAMSSLATAQQAGGVVLTAGSVTIDASTSAGSLTLQSVTLDPAAFQSLVVDTSVQVFAVSPMDSVIGAATQGSLGSSLPPVTGLLRADESSLVAIDREGMRLPEQRLDAIRRPLMPFDPHEP